MTLTSIPRAPGEITAAWLAAALGPKILDGASVSSFAAREIGAEAGNLTKLVRLSLCYDRPTAAPASLVAKFAAPDIEARAMAQWYDWYENEAHFYRELAAEMPVCTPRCYFVHSNPTTWDFVALLADVSEAQRVAQFAGCPPDRAALVIREMAAMHAFWWEHPRLPELSWLHRLTDSMYVEGLAYLYHRNAPISLEQLGDLAPRWFPSFSVKFGEALGPLLQRLDAFPQTLAHGDFRLDNLLFGDGVETSPLTILDWQLLLRGPGAYDLGYFLSQSLSIEDRRAHEEDLLTIYHDHLLRGGVRNCDREELYQAYRMACLYCIVYPMIAGASLDAENPRALDLLRCSASRAWAAIEDHNAMDLLTCEHGLAARALSAPAQD